MSASKKFTTNFFSVPRIYPLSFQFNVFTGDLGFADGFPGPACLAQLPRASFQWPGIFPENEEELIRELAALQGYDVEETFMFSSETKGHPFPTPVTVLDALKKYCDITGLIKKKALKELAMFATDPAAKERLEFLASLKGKEEFRSVIEEPVLTIVDLFHLFPSLKVPIGALVQILDRIAPRYYFISSSAAVQPGHLSIVVQLTKKRTCEGRNRYGLCSSQFYFVPPITK